MSDRAPKPPVAAKTDIRDFRFMPLDVVQLANSETWAMADGWEAKALINLWCRAWHQVPAGSLPDNDNLLRTWAGVPDWESVREVALRGFRKCRDGRLYHDKLCEKVLEAWGRKEASFETREAERQRKKEWRERKRQRNQQPRPVGRDADKNGTRRGRPTGRDANVPSMTGTGTGTKEKNNGGGLAALDDLDAILYRRGKSTLGNSAGGVITRLKDELGTGEALEVIDIAARKENPMEYVQGILRKRGPPGPKLRGPI